VRRAWAGRATALALGAAIAIAGGSCGQGASSPQQTRAKPPHAAQARSVGAPIGATQRAKVSRTRLAVTVRRVIDPLRHSGAVVDPGGRAVGVVLQVRNLGPAVYDSSSKSDLALFSEGGTEAASAYASEGRCATPEVDFLRQLQAGSSGEGCVVFSVEEGASVERVRFSPEGHEKQALTWAGHR
jgi:hypothetical protein